MKALRPTQRRELVDLVRYESNQSILRVCELFLVDRSTYDYQSKRADQADLKKRIKEICETRVRYGYRRVGGGCSCVAKAGKSIKGACIGYIESLACSCVIRRPSDV